MEGALKLLREAATLLAVAAATVGAVAFFLQRSMLFPRVDRLGPAPRPADAQEIWLQADAQTRVEAWYLPATVSSPGPAPLLIFTHGNAEYIDRWPAVFAGPRSWGLGVLLVEYPGYGRSGGKPSEASVTATMLAAWDWAIAQPAIDRSRIVLYGRSLGGGAACALAAQRPPAALVLESTFTSVRAFAGRFLMPGFLVRDPFDNLARVRQWRGPLLIIHGRRDEVVPFAQGEALARAAAQAEFLPLDCGHNDCPRQWPALEAFLRRHGVLRTAETNPSAMAFSP